MLFRFILFLFFLSPNGHILILITNMDGGTILQLESNLVDHNEQSQT